MNDVETPAYLIVCGSLSSEIDPEYGRRAAPLAQEYGLLPVAGGAIGEQVEVLEGGLPQGTEFLAIERFPSMDKLKMFYHSKEYQEAIPLRSKSVKINFIAAVDGIA